MRSGFGGAAVWPHSSVTPQILNARQVQRQMEVIALRPGPLFDFPSRSCVKDFVEQHKTDSVSPMVKTTGNGRRKQWPNSSFFLSFFDHLTSSLASDFHPGEGYHQTHHLPGLAAT